MECIQSMSRQDQLLAQDFWGFPFSCENGFRVKAVVTSELREKRFFRQLFGSNSTERHIHSISLIFFVPSIP